MFGGKRVKGIDLFENYLHDEDKVTFHNDSITMKQVREYEKNFKPTEKMSNNLTIFYDDIVQFTTLGLLELLIDHFDDIENKDYNVEEFFYRGFKNSHYITFIQNYFKVYYDKDLTEEFIREFHKEHYAETLLNSPATTMFQVIVKCESLYHTIKIVFRHNFEGIEKWGDALKNDHFTIFKGTITCDHLERFNNDECEYLLNSNTDHDIIMIQYLIKAFEYVENTKIKGLSLVSPNIHNGVDPNYFNNVLFFLGSHRRGPHNSEVTLFNEGISVC